MASTSLPGVIAALEAGGTKFNCALLDTELNIIAQAAFPTTTPEQTLALVNHFFQQTLAAQQLELIAMGIASFGPVDLIPSSATYGYITNTPKPNWSNIDICGYFSRELNVPIAFETDVNGAAWGEKISGAARDLSDYIYVTIGTGIGAGIVVNNKLLRGLGHPEIGHMLMPRDLSVDAYSGCCPFHGDCLEGLASGKSIESRWGVSGKHLKNDHPAWDIEAQYLAVMCANLTQIIAPQKIILGGGVMDQPHLLPMIHRYFLERLNGYAPAAVLANTVDYIVQTPLQGMAGIVGIAALALSKVK
ncbi:ROK family protein [Cellvibrio sp. OA-2007]|uniref:ROK family protein n=1 Tax=Cellvibrio sp. OA-2007 TaxID=529823 RepID=UPI0007831BA5|nr:ROK family protein [Cellvibrio sp. OA-2007]